MWNARYLSVRFIAFKTCRSRNCGPVTRMVTAMGQHGGQVKRAHVINSKSVSCLGIIVYVFKGYWNSQDIGSASISENKISGFNNRKGLCFSPVEN